MSVKFSNNATTELASSIGTSDTSITVVDASKFPILTAGDYTYVTLDTDTASPTREIVKVTAISGNVLTVARGQDGTSPASFAAGTKVELRLTAALLNDVAGANPSGEPIGFPDKSQTTITFDSGIRTFSITPTGASFDVYCKGVKYTYTTVQLVTIPNTTGLHFIYFNASGVLSTQMSYFTWEEHAPTAYVYWNATTQQAIYFGDERHGITLDWQTHEYLHRTRGAAIANGFAASGYTTTGLGATDADAQIDIGGGTFFDEDMQVDIISTNTPVAGTWQQDLSGPARIPVLYLSGSAWVIDAPTNFPFKVVSSVPQYNLYSGGSWSTASVTNNSYFVSWILATNNLTYPVISIISQAPTNQLSVAEAMTFEGLNLNGFPSVEFRPLYKVIYQYKEGFANSVKSSTIAVYDLRSISSAGVAAALVQDHGNLSGLTDDDHPQYVHTSEVRTPSAAVKNSFFPSQVGQTGKYLSTDGTNTVWEPAPSGSLSFTGDVTGSGSTGSSVAMTLAASGVVAGQYTKVTVDSKGRVTAGTGVTSADVTSALGYTPYNATNPAGYTTNVGTVTSVSGTGTVSGLTLTGSVTSSGSLTLGGTLSLTSGQVTTALGFTPYNATNPSGYITGITSGMVTSALGYTPYNSSNPSGYTNNTGTVTSVSGTGTVSGLTLTGTVTGSGSLTLGGTLSLTSGQVTSALGYTPLALTGLAGQTSAATGSVAGGGGRWLRIATLGGNWFYGRVKIWDGSSSGPHQSKEFTVSGAFNDRSKVSFVLLSGGSYNYVGVSKVRYLSASTYDPQYLEVYIDGAGSDSTWTVAIFEPRNASAVGFSTGSVPSGYTSVEWDCNGAFAAGSAAGGFRVGYDNSAFVNGNTVLHAGNYNDYAPSRTGGSASGTWGIRITGFANQGTARLYSTDAAYNYDSGAPYYGYLTYDGSRWLFQVSPGTPAAVRVAYADAAGSATDSTKLPLSGGTLTGGLNVGTAIGSRATSLSVSGSTNSSAIAAKSSDYATVFGVLPHSGSYTYFSTGVYYQSGSWVHASSNDNSALFSISGNLGAQWWASSNSSASWNLASGASLWNVSGTWIGALNAASGAQVNGSNIWHAGNFTPGNYLALSGGTLSGAIRAPQITAGGSTNTDANLGVQGTSHLTGQIYYGGTVGNVNSWSSTSTSVSGTHTFSGSRFIFDRYGYGSQPLIDMQSSSITFGQPAYAGSGITVNNASADGRGINLYSGSPTSPDYGLFFAQTGNFSTYGSVSGDWATYFTMNNDPARGWIFRNVGAGNVAAINARGDMTLKSHLELGNNLGYPNVEWNTASSSSGMVIFYLPGTTGNYGMVHMVFDIYEYDSPRVATVIVGGHNWSTSWYNIGCNVVGYTDKQVRVGVKNGRFCVVFGTSGSGWSYGTVILRKVHNGGFYNNNMNMTGDWETAQTTTESFTYVSGDLRGLRTPSTMQVDGILYGYNSIRSNIFYDNDNTSYYIDGASTSRLNELQSDRTYGFTDIRSPIFYDYNNTGYYCDPASSSRLSTIYCGDVYNDLGGWFRNYGATGIYNQSYGNHFYSDSANYWNVGIGGQTSGGIRFRDNHAGTVRGYVYVDNGDNIGFLNSSGSWKARVVGGDYFLAEGSSIRGQIYYDSNDTSYYCNPNDWSLLWGLRTYYIQNNYDVGTDHPFGLFFANGGSTAYAIYRESGAWTYPYPDLRIAFHTGIKLGANSSYNGIRFYDDYTMVNQVMSVNNGSDPLGGGNVYVNSALQAGGSLRAPIFYDANNTGYYIDPAASTAIRTVGSWRADSADWDGEFSGKIQYHSSIWYFQAATGWQFRNSAGSQMMFCDNGGNVTFNGNVTAYSDRRLKDNVRDLTGAKAYLNKISAKRFTWKDDGYEDIGFIAQDVEAAGLTEFVLETADYDPNTETTGDPVKSLDYGRMVSVLWQVVKEQELQISSMLDEIKSLKERLH